MRNRRTPLGPVIALASGTLVALCAWRAVRRMMHHLLPDWPVWDARTFGFD